MAVAQFRTTNGFHRRNKTLGTRVMNAIVNPLVKAVLRSPAHGLLDRNVLLVTVAGHRTGRIYTMPVNYVREDGFVTVMSQNHRTWWRNLRDGGAAQVQVLLKGKLYGGIARVLDLNAAQKVQAYAGYMQRLTGKRVPDERLAEAWTKVFVSIELLP